MAKQSNQKQKLLYILKILEEQSDEEHLISAQKLIEELEKNDVSAERKSIYDDIKQLQDFGYDIIHVKSKSNGGYYLASRMFEVAELKLLVDAIQSFRFISLKKSRDLIRKMETLLSHHEAVLLNRQVFVNNRIKTENEAFYYQVDEIHKAIRQDCVIEFVYLEWNSHKELVPKKNGALYKVSPFALTCKEENYYLIAYDAAEEKIKHFRVDKMSKTQALENERRDGYEHFRKFDLAAYTNKTFGMFGGQEEEVTMDMDIRLIGVVLDRFGKDIYMRKLDENTVRVRVAVALSGQFYGWLTGLSAGAKIVSPKHVVEEYVDHLKSIQKLYTE